jgi:hypothetical protein
MADRILIVTAVGVVTLIILFIVNTRMKRNI